MSRRSHRPRATLEQPGGVRQNIDLVCRACGRRDTYDVGTILYWKQGEGKSAPVEYAYSNYFRCRGCGSAGPWDRAPSWSFLAASFGAMLRGGSKRFQAATPQLFDGSSHQTPALAEEHLLRRLAKEPRNAFLHTRLGNLLRGCGARNRAIEWYEKALTLDPGDIEARINLLMFAVEKDESSAVLEHASLLVRHLLAGRRTNKEDLTRDTATFVVQTLRWWPEFQTEYRASGRVGTETPERTFIRTLLEQSGDDGKIETDAAERLLLGRATPAPSSPAADTPASPAVGEKKDPLDLIASLRAVVEEEGLDPRRLSVAVPADDVARAPVTDRHTVFVSDGETAGLWQVPSLQSLYRGHKAPRASLDEYPREYDPCFLTVEHHVRAINEDELDPTDQEMESIYSALRRRPDGKHSLGPTHDIIWQASALMLGMFSLSEAEFRAIMSYLERAVRSRAQRPISRNYAAYLREIL